MSLLTEFPNPVPPLKDITTKVVANGDFTPEVIRIKPIEPPNIPPGFFAKSKSLTIAKDTLAKACDDLHSALSDEIAKNILQSKTQFDISENTKFDTDFNVATYRVGKLYRATIQYKGDIATMINQLQRLKTDILTYKAKREAEAALEVKDKPTMEQMFDYLLLKGKLDIIQGAADDLVRKFPVQAVGLVQEGPSAVFKLSKIQSMFTGVEKIIKQSIAYLFK